MPSSTTTSRGRVAQCLCAVSAFAGAALTATFAGRLPAQDALRGWGNNAFATDVTAVPTMRLAPSTYGLGIVRTDSVVSMAGYAMPNEPGPPPAGLQFLDVSIPGRLALLNNGQLFEAWGTGTAGAGTPPTPPPGVIYLSLSCSITGHAVALRSDGVAKAWGIGTAGQTSLPTMPAGVTATDVHAAYNCTLLLRSDGELIGVGSGAVAQVPPLPAGVVYTRVWGGTYHAFAERSDGQYVGWGFSSQGQLLLPAPAPGTFYETIACGYAHSAALRSDGEVVYCGGTPGLVELPPTPAGRSIAQLVAGQHTAALLDDGSIIGSDGFWELRVPSPPAGEHWRSVASGAAVLGLTTGGDVHDFVGNLGTIPPRPPGVTYTSVKLGSSHAIALRSDGRAVAWGNNFHGQLNIPPLPPGMTWTDAAGGSTWTALLRSDGLLVRIGGQQPGSTAPPPGLTWTKIEADGNYYVLLRNDGQIDSDNTYAAAQTPPLPQGLRYVDVAIGSGLAALRSDGEVQIWSSSGAPTMPPLPAGVCYVDVDATGTVFVALRSDGRITAVTSSGAILPPPEPRAGESFVEATAGYGGTVRVGPTRTYVGFASGCAGTLPASRIVPRDTPFIGGTFRATVFDVPQDLALVVFGQQVAPVPLAAIGMPGCELHVSLDASVFVAGQDQQVAFALPIPNSLALLGATFANQAFALDHNANAAGFVASDAAVGVVGRR